MKRLIFNIFILATTLIVGCSKFDDSELRSEIDGYMDRVESLMQQAEALSEELADLSNLTNGNVITSVEEDSDGNFVVTYKDSSDAEYTVVIAPNDAVVDLPIVGVEVGDDGLYYWTTIYDGVSDWLLDDDENKIPVSGYTPTISVDEDGYWTVDGVQVLDADSNPISASNSESSILKSAEIDADGNFVVTFSDDSQITLPVFNTLNLLHDSDAINTIYNLGNDFVVSYSLSGSAAEYSIVEIAKAESIEVVHDRDAQSVTVSFDEYFQSGTLILMAYDLDQNVVIKPIQFKSSEMSDVVISTADQLVAFATAVNAGGSEANAKVLLTADIDLDGVEWTPIGNGGVTGTTTYTLDDDCASFKGEFDGAGHSIKNLSLVVPSSATADRGWGLFGVAESATIKNVVMASSCSITCNAEYASSVGGIVGISCESTIESCVNNASITLTGGLDAKRQAVGGIVGTMFVRTSSAVVTGCTNNGTLKSTNSISDDNGYLGISVGGVVGFASALSTNTTIYNEVSDCENYGAINSEATRVGGIIATMDKYTTVSKCQNSGTIVASGTKPSNSRVAGIVSSMGNYTFINNCINHADVSFAIASNTTQGFAAGVVGQVNGTNTTTIDACENYGTILSDIINGSTPYIAAICANANGKSLEISNCKVGGAVGAYSDGESGATQLTSENYESYIYATTSSTLPTLINNTYSLEYVGERGIASAEDLIAFRDAVNSGASTADWQNDSGEVVLLNDIDMSDVSSWDPIGAATSTWSSNTLTIAGTPFTGVFNGQGFAIKNLKLAYSGTESNATYGLFGVLDGATVKNLVIGAASSDSSSLTITASGSGMLDTGVIAGVANESTVSNCTNYASMTYSGTRTSRVTMGMVGFIFCEATPTSLDNLINYGEVSVPSNGNTANGATSVQVAGICGFSTNDIDSYVCNIISYSTNNGDMSGNVARCSGIVAAANRYTTMMSCVNNGDQFNSFSTSGNGRLGNITCITGAGATMSDCINNGDLVSTTEARCGGLVSLPNSATNSFSGCANYGAVVTDSAYRGLFFGYNNLETTWINCVAGGSLAAYNNGSYAVVTYADSAKSSYLGSYGTSYNPILENITYAVSGEQAGDTVEATLKVLFIGNSFTKDAVEHLPGMITAAGINSVKITHVYYGGRTIPEYNSGYETTSDYYCYNMNTNSSIWVASNGGNIKEVVESEDWDIVSIQAHTGNIEAWVWDDGTEKSAIEELITKIKADQGSNVPKFVYIMSQAYYNMSKISSSFTYTDYFTTQAEMYSVITAQAQKVLDETQIEEIIPTGTMLQNLRTTSLNIDNDMDLTRDGYHMDYGISRYGAAALVYNMVIKPSFPEISLDDNTYRYTTSSTSTSAYSTPVTDDNKPIALKAAENAQSSMFTVTNMSNY